MGQSSEAKKLSLPGNFTLGHTEHAHPGQPHTRGVSWKYAPPHPLADWLEKTEHEAGVPSADGVTSVAGTTLPHPHAGPLLQEVVSSRQNRSEHFCDGSQCTAAPAFFVLHTILPAPARRLRARAAGPGTGVGESARKTRLCILASLWPPLGLGFLRGKTSGDWIRRSL